MRSKSQLVAYVTQKISVLKSVSNAYKKQRITNKVQKNIVEPLSLHLGCGLTRFEEWLNIDRFNVTGVTDIVWDLRNGIPVPDSSCRFIYSEHLLEHLSVNDGVALLRECYRVLCLGGVVRIAMPSLEEVVDIYVKDSWQTLGIDKMDAFKFVKTSAELINMSFYWWEHQWLYDREELHRRLNEAGFSIICDNEWGNSNYSELQNLESRIESKLICEARK